MNLAQRLQNKIIGVTGSSGYLGSEIVNALNLQGINSVPYSRSSQANLNPKAVQIDYLSSSSWREVVQSSDVIIHLAGNTSLEAATVDPAGCLNDAVLPLIYLIEAAKKLKRIPKVIFASTASLYGDTDGHSTDEGGLISPTSNYDLYKHYCESILFMAAKFGALEAISLRISNVYGVSSRDSFSQDRGILNKITKLCLAGQDLHIYGDGEYLRDYIYISDVVEAFLQAAALNNASGQAFNIGYGKSVTINSAFRLAASKAQILTGKKVNISNVPWPRNTEIVELRSFTACTRKFSEKTGWKAKVSLSDGLDRLIDCYLNSYSLGT